MRRSRKKRKRLEGADNGSCYFTHEDFSNDNCEGSLKPDIVLSKKRTRQYRWQRQRKRRQSVVQEKQSLIPCTENSCASNTLSGELPNYVHTSSRQSCECNISHCTCCTVFQNEPKMNRNAEIDRQMVQEYHSLTKLLKSLIRESQNCRYLRLLDKHCPMGSSYQDASRDTGTGLEGNVLGTCFSKTAPDGAQLDGNWFRVSNARNSMTQATTDLVEPSKCYCPKTQVVSFIWAICRRIIPSPLLGEPSNWRVLRKNISKFIRLRKFEKFSLKECIHKLKLSKFPLLSNKHCGDRHNRCSEIGLANIARNAIFQCWMYWFFACLVSPLVQANFYVTESEHEKQEVLYYRKSTWEKLIREAECVKGGRYRQLDHASTGKIIGKRSFGFSKARLRPKQFGFRMLTNLQAPSRMRVNPPFRTHSNQKLPRKLFSNHRVKYRFFKSVNSVLHDLHVVLKGLRTKEPENLGSSVFDYNDVYRKLVPFLYLLKNGSDNNMPSVFIVVSDVSKAFDSVNQDKLLSVMKDVILDDVYRLEKFTQVICTKTSLKVHQHMALLRPGIVEASAKVSPRLPANTLDCVLIKKELGRNIRKDEIISILKEHITRNVFRLHNNFYLQCVGIPQGSVLSSLLCSFYYGHMERNVVFPFLEKATENLLGGFGTSEKPVASGPSYLLLRFIDDFLFISTSKKQASMFFSRLERGVRDYNCCMNEEKYGLNFNMNNGQECMSNRRHVGKDGISYLRWSGLLLNCSTLEIQADYTRYLNTHLSSTLTVSCRGKVGRQLKSKLRCYLRPKCHPIFYDSQINSPRVVRLNIYQVFLLCAMKFICYIKNLSILPRFSPKFHFNAIDASLRYMNRLIKRKMYSFEVDAAFRPKYNVKKKDIMWLGLYAYSRVLKKKQSRYKELLGLLISKLKAYGKVKNMSSDLKYAIDDAHSSVLWSIKY
ncbi:hypothetical protein OROMI_014402 [Orobanche minor]